MQKNILSGIVGVVIGFIGSQFLMSPTDHGNSSVAENQPTMDHHTHEITTVADSAPTPAISIEAIKDTKDGYNVKITTENYTFTPEAINSENVQNEGHAHIYINDIKIARLYGNWFHAKADLFTPGQNDITVILNANDHKEWAINGTAISDSVTVTK